MADEQTLDFFSIFRRNVERFPDRTAYVNITKAGRETYSYREIDREVRLVSRYLQQHGVEPGSTVGILMENHPRWGIAFMAAQSAGAIVLPLDILHTAETLAGLIAHAECDFLISSGKQLGLLDEAQARLPQPLPALINGQASGRETWEQVLGGGDEAVGLPLVEGSLDDPALIMYTSGTTGDPKGVVLTRRGMFRNIVEILELVEVTDRDNFLGVLPLYHILALMVNFLAPLFTGSRMTYLDILEPQQILKTFDEEGITIFVCVPQFYYLVYRRIQQEIEKQPWAARFLFNRLYAISRFSNRRLGINAGRWFFGRIHRRFGRHLRIFAVGGARFDEDVARAYSDLGFTLLQAYGMTETSAVVTLAGFDPRAVGSVGRPLPHAEVRIDNPGEDGIGEVVVRGESIMVGYWKRPDATAEVLDDEGWLRTGDLGYLSSAGYLYITGRLKDVIVLGSGKNIYPEEIEEAYQKRCQFIKEMCVVGVSDADGAQERLHGVVVPDFDALKAAQIVNAFEIIRHMMENISQELPAHKRVRGFDISRDPLPRTTTRKIKRHEVEAMVRRGIDAGEEPEAVEPDRPADELEEKVFSAAAHLKPEAVLTYQGNLELDLGLDSLERVEFLSGVQESLGVEFSDDEAAGLLTLQEVIDLARARLESASSGGAPTAVRSWDEILSEPVNAEDAAMVHERLRRRPFVEFLFTLFALANYWIFRVLFRMKVRGLEHLPGDYPYLLCPNHLSYLDAFVVGAPLPAREVRHLFALGYADYFSGGLTGLLGQLVKVIPVSPDKHLRQALRLAAEGLRLGLVLMVFPEGERSIDGDLKVFRKGPAILATHLQVPVVPVGIQGTFEAWRRASGRIRLHPISITYGPPLTPREGESADDFNDRLKEAVRELIR